MGFMIRFGQIIYDCVETLCYLNKRKNFFETLNSEQQIETGIAFSPSKKFLEIPVAGQVLLQMFRLTTDALEIGCQKPGGKEKARFMLKFPKEASSPRILYSRIISLLTSPECLLENNSLMILAISFSVWQ